MILGPFPTVAYFSSNQSGFGEPFAVSMARLDLQLMLDAPLDPNNAR